MIFRTSFLVTVLAASCVLMGCSADDGKPSGSGTGTGTGGGTGTGTAATTPAEGDAAAAEPGAKKGFTEACAGDAECASGLCYTTDKGDKYCTIRCTAATATDVCVAPLAGTCNGKGYCKKP